MSQISRRNFMKLGIASGALIASGQGLEGKALAGSIKLEYGGKDFSPETRKERKAIPTACWSCVTRCAAMGFVEDGRFVKMESNPESIRTMGKMCSKGQSAPNEVYFPDRILYPLKRVGKRGEGKWKRISWDEALTELTERLKKLRDEGHPEKFMFHYGRMKGSSSKLIKSLFLETYGTKTIGNHTTICEGGKWVAQELTWGKHYDNWDFDNTKYILNFGSNVQEAHTNHIPTSQRLVSARVERGVKLVTFDVRLSNTAAKSDEWIPIRPGTDGAVVLAMCNVIMSNNLYDKEFFTFIKATEKHDDPIDKKIEALKSHLKQYTPQWAEKISGVSAAKIEQIAKEFASAKPAVVISYRGAVAHYNGNDTERAIQMLAAITGNVDNPGGRCKGVGAKWKYPKGPKDKPKGTGLDIVNGFKGQIAYPTHHASHQVLKMIKDGSNGRPDIYMWYCYNPVYVNGECQENIDVLKDENMIPFTVTSNIVYDETSRLADMILPDATYLERWDWEDHVSPTQVPEYYIRQPLVKPLGEARDLGDVVCELAERLGTPLGVRSKEEFVKISHEMTAKDVKGFPGYEYMVQRGVWHDPDEKPHYYSYKKEVKPEDLEGAIYDEKTGVYWKGNQGEDYTTAKKAFKHYVGQKIGDRVFEGFKPDGVNKSGYLELYSELLKMKGFEPLPAYYPIPEHEKKGSGELILTTYKVAVHIHSRSTHRKWLTELYHNNPGWINPATASSLGIKDGDSILVKSNIGQIQTKARVTEGIVPGVIAMSMHLGRTESGRFASGKKSPMAHDNDPDLQQKWWDAYGVHPNWVIANSPDPINGQQRWMDTVVSVSKA